MNGNESTLPLSGQGDSPGHQNDRKSVENYTIDKKQNSTGNIRWTSERHERNPSRGSGVTGSDGNMLDLENENAKIRAEIARMTALLERERKIAAEAAEKDKAILELRKSIKKATLEIETMRSIKSKSSGLPEIASKNEGNKAVIPVLSGRKMKILYSSKKTFKMDFALSDLNSENYRKPAIRINLPFSVKSSARDNPIKGASTTRNFERTASGGSSPSKFLIRKLSDQGRDFFTSQTHNSSREQLNEESAGIKDTKERLYKVSRVVGDQNKQENEGATNRASEGNSRVDDFGLTARKSNATPSKGKNDDIGQLLFAIFKKVDKVFQNYTAEEREMAVRNEKLLKILDQKLKEREKKNK